ncbi:DUF805 domain-containing protein [Kribbella italica]|uniref:Uncharacterized membrane protein YhaH (DUF805 family) n=1 Tax=Kribbella italica TaxID=1540520 RepID=A0A7W9JGS3_9ACTN|nr:DUF805 domain-containing protein [Kribbella italica]MBB5841540.1 uncharacterized membrane protein YhaH (DUF805 family) [Kribbella italica]
MQWYLDVLKKYVVFSGRARRKEFWMFTLFSTIISIVLGVVDRLIGTDNSSGTGLLGGIYSLLVLLPSLGVMVRRLHDTNRSGFWIFIGLIPIIGWIVLLVFAIQEGTAGENGHGPDPKGAERFGTAAGSAEPGYPTV